MTKQNIMPVVVLTVICLAVAILLGAVNMLTKDTIAANALLKEQASLIEVLPSEAGFDQLEVTAEMSSTVSSVYKEKAGGGYVFIVKTSTQYSKGDTVITVGIKDGEVIGIKLTAYYDSKNFGSDYPDNFIGKDIDSYSDVAHVSGVTYSSEAFKNAVGDALAAEAILTAGTSTVSEKSVIAPLSAKAAELPKTDEELSELINELVDGVDTAEFTLTADAPEALKKLYTTANGGAVAYIVVPGEWVPVATEALVYINSQGVIENINLLSWIVGHGVEPGSFASDFIGKSFWNYGEIELVSGATGTSKDFYDNTSEALLFVTDILNARERVILDRVDEMIPNSGEIVKVELNNDAPSVLVSLYRDLAGHGSVAYVIVPGEWVPVATEALISFDEFGTIREVDLRSWVVGHGIEPGDFADRFVGKNKDTVLDVELVSGATGTSNDFRNAVVDIIPFIPTEFPIWRIVGIIGTVLLAAFIAAYTVFNRRRRMGKK